MARKRISRGRLETPSEVLSRINEVFGEGTVVLGKDVTPTYFCPTGIPCLDVALGGGIAENKFTEVFGEFSSGKSTFAYDFGTQWQGVHPSGIVFISDLERNFDKKYGKLRGLDLDRVIVHQPSSGEDAGNAISTFVDACPEGLIILDSVAALISESFYEKDMSEREVAPIARLCGAIIKKVHRATKSAPNAPGHTVLFLNQTRTSIGVMWGDPNHSPGGQFKDFTCSQIIYLKRLKKDRKKKTVGGETVDEVDSYNIGFEVKKDKVSHGLGARGELSFLLKDTSYLKAPGFDVAISALKQARIAGLVKKSGASLVYTVGSKTISGEKNILLHFASAKARRELVAKILGERAILVRTVGEKTVVKPPTVKAKIKPRLG